MTQPPRSEIARAIVAGIDALNERIGRAIAWLTLAMVLVVVAIVIGRYFFGFGAQWLTESVTWMHAAVFMLGAAYTLRHDEHVRVDVFYRTATARRRAWADLAGTLLFLLPFCAFLLYEGIPYLLASWRIGEGSREAGGLPALYLLKGLIPLAAALLALQGCALLLRSVLVLTGARADRH
ncbi:MAG TPA: TRAP transporter small permease subunit [Steroidobacteraceae bacterium]|nr:TRAP transporter small permease subunit [Steroidobacteraceae bacterium]